MKKKIFNLLLLVVISLAVVLTTFGFKPRVARAVSENLEENSLFFVDVKDVFVNNNKVYVYDNADKLVKIIDKDTGDFLETNNSFSASLTKLLFYKNNIIIYDQESEQKFSAVNETDFSKVMVTNNITLTQNVKTMQIISLTNKDYLLICPENPVEEDFMLSEIKFEDSKITFEEPKTFKAIESVVGSIESYNLSLALKTDDDKIMIIFCGGSTRGMNALTIDPENINSEERTIVGISGLSNMENEEIVNLSRLEIAGTPYLAITTRNFIELYTINTSEKTISAAENKKATIEGDFEITSADGGLGIVSLISNANQSVRIYDFTKTDVNVPNELKNPNILINQFNWEDYKYLTLTQDVNLKENPFSKNEVVTAKRGENIAIIGEGRYETTYKRVENWDYVIYTSNGKNYYGFISNKSLYTTDLSTLEYVHYDKSYVSVLAYTPVYKLPTTNPDQLNTKVTEIKVPSKARLEVLSDLCDYSTLFGEVKTKFLLVRVNGDNSKIGFIERARILSSPTTHDLVINNATVMRNSSEIFMEKDDSSLVLMTLNKGYRVRVVGNRDTITNLTHVVFNDDEGNEIEGYIYTYNLEADSWNMVQMIGMILIIINIVLLVIIICIKNKLTR